MRCVKGYKAGEESYPITEANEKIARVRIAQGAQEVTIPVPENYEDNVRLYGKGYADLQRWQEMVTAHPPQAKAYPVDSGSSTYGNWGGPAP